MTRLISFGFVKRLQAINLCVWCNFLLQLLFSLQLQLDDKRSKISVYMCRFAIYIIKVVCLFLKERLHNKSKVETKLFD